jgi:hypothetical protein
MTGARGLSVLLAAIIAGCYQYHDAVATSVRPDERVHIVLSSDASSSLASTIGPNATSIDGRVLSVDSNRMRLAVTQIARAVGPEEFLQSEPLDVPTRGALAVSVRSVDRFRTLLAFGGILAGVVAAQTLSNSPGVFSTRGAPASGSK